MSVDAARKREPGIRHLGDVVMQITRAQLRPDPGLSDEPKDHGDVVRRETPEDVLFASDRPSFRRLE